MLGPLIKQIIKNALALCIDLLREPKKNLYVIIVIVILLITAAAIYLI
jgi:hypothetical protein